MGVLSLIIIVALSRGFYLVQPIGFKEAGYMPPVEISPASVPKEKTPEEKGVGATGEVRGEAGGGNVFTLERMIIYNAHVSLRVKTGKIKDAVDKLQEIGIKYGGYIAHSEIYEDRAYVTLRIPSDNFTNALDSISQIGQVISTQISTEDVTEQYIDLKARLRNAQREEERLLEILEKANTVEDILKVESFLKSVREEIERLQAQITYLERRVEYSTITVSIQEEFTRPPPKPQWPVFDPTGAIINGIKYMYTLIYIAITLLITFTPIIIILVLLYLFYTLVRKKLPAISTKKKS